MTSGFVGRNVWTGSSHLAVRQSGTAIARQARRLEYPRWLAERLQPPRAEGRCRHLDCRDREPSAPRMPNFLFQNPRNRSAQISHSETPKNQLAPRMPKTGYIQKIRGPLLMYGISTWASYSNHF